MAASPTEPAPGRPGSLQSPSDSAPAGGDRGKESRGTREETGVAIAIATIIAGVFIWWAWKQGAYFGSVFLPGAMILYCLLILLLLAAPLRVRLAGPGLVAIATLAALAGWTLLSLLWTPSQEAAVQDIQRVALYAVIFVLGIWACNLAGRRTLVPFAAIAATAAVIGVVITVTLAGGVDVSSFFHVDATLRFPIGYRNAEGAFLLICLWPVVTLAAEGNLPWPARALLVGIATMLLDLAILSQSRGSLPAACIGLAVFLLLSPRRLRAAVYLALAAIPVAFALPTLLDLYQQGGDGAELIPLMRDSARAIAFSTVGSILLAALLVRGVELKLDLGRERVALISRAAAVAAIVVTVIGGLLFVQRHGGPIDFLDQRVSEFSAGGNPDLRAQGTRFGVNVGTNRGDFWRVSLDQGGDHPLLGGGPGSFAITYLQKRDSDESPRDPHSVEMLMLSELGGVGLLLLLAFAGTVTWAALRSRKAGGQAAALVAGALAAGSYWFAHASYDWFWHYPAITAPAIFLLGTAIAPGLRQAGAGNGTRARYAGAAAVGVALLLALPLFLSDRYANEAYERSSTDPQGAIEDLDRAADLDPYAPDPLLAMGLIATEAGNEEDALGYFRDGLEREPDNYAAHFFYGRALAPSDPAAALAELEEAARLNPLDRMVARLQRRLEQETAP